VRLARTLKAVETAIRNAEAGIGNEGRQIRRGRFDHHGRQRGGLQGLNKAARPILDFRQVVLNIFSHGPRVGEAGAVVVAQEGLLLALRRFPSTALRRAVRKVPGQEKTEFAALPSGNGLPQRYCPGWRAEAAVPAKAARL